MKVADNWNTHPQTPEFGYRVEMMESKQAPRQIRPLISKRLKVAFDPRVLAGPQGRSYILSSVVNIANNAHAGHRVPIGIESFFSGNDLDELSEEQLTRGQHLSIEI
jgi:hypothetical protein